MEKNVSLIAFRQILTKILSAAWIQLHTYDIWKSSIKTKSLNTKHWSAGLSPRIICQVSPLTKISKNCCTHQVWTVPLSPEPLWEALGMVENPTQHPKMYSSSPSEKSPLIDLNLLILKVLFLPHQIAIFK